MLVALVRLILTCNTVLVKQSINTEKQERIRERVLERMQGYRECLLMTKIKFYRMILFGTNIKGG